MAGKASKPTFFWQGVLILLPVLLMAGFGIWAILRERKAVEQDARQRAQEILQSLTYNLGQRLAFRMGFLALQSSDRSWIPENAATGGAVQKWGAAGNLMPGAVTNNIASIASTNSSPWTSLSDQVWPMNFILDSNRDFWDLTYQEAPKPPEWFATMNDVQRSAWSALRESDTDTNAANEISLRVEDFLNTTPPEPARRCAEFIRLRAESEAKTDSDAIESLLRFASDCPDAEMDSGLPLSNLAMAELLRRAQPGRSSAAIQKQLAFEVCYRPSLLTPALLDQAERFASRDTTFGDSLKQLRAICRARELQRDLAERIKLAHIPCDVGTITNFWIPARGEPWFCLLQPERVLTSHTEATKVIYRVIYTTNTFSEIIPFPESFLTKSLCESLDEVQISLPDYLSLIVNLEGNEIFMPNEWSHGIASTSLNDQIATGMQYSAEDALARQQIMLSSPTGPRFEIFSRHPRVTIYVVLVHRNLLYARQRQRQVIFGTLIAFATVAALVGFIMARRAFNTQLQLSESKSNFVSSVSHELRAPIASVRLMAESLERGKVSEAPKQNEYFRFIVQECRRLSSLIENVLDFSRIEQGRKQYEFEPTDLAALTRETVKLMEPYAAEKGVILEISLPIPERSEHDNSAIRNPQSAIEPLRNPQSELEVDGRAIQQALVNLMDNALKHSPKGSVVKIGFECDSHFARLWVEDHGPGIPPEEHERIFERFYRLGSELRRETQGVGIGLSIVRHIVEAHGGKVTVRSSVGQGSRFTIELPLTSKTA
jgi:signal transduction histidine kinase